MWPGLRVPVDHDAMKNGHRWPQITDGDYTKLTYCWRCVTKKVSPSKTEVGLCDGCIELLRDGEAREWDPGEDKGELMRAAAMWEALSED